MSRPVIVVLDGHTLNPGDNPWDAVAALGALRVHPRTRPEQTLDRARGADILLTNKTVLDEETLAGLPALRFVSVLATGYNVVDVAAAGRRGIPVSNVPEYATEAVVQHAVALILAMTSGVAANDAAVKAGAWCASPDFALWRPAPVELAGSTLGIVGFGRIGRGLARVGHALGVRIAVHTPRPPAVSEVPVRFLSLPDLAGEADVLCLACPLTPENAGFVNASFLASMRPGARLVNTARGGLVDEQALAAALRRGHLAGAALDVVSREPIGRDNPLLRAPNVIITPHLAWASLAARKRLMGATAANVASFLEGRPSNVVNAPSAAG